MAQIQPDERLPLFQLPPIFFDDFYQLLDEPELLSLSEGSPFAEAVIKAREQVPSNRNLEIAIEKGKAWVMLCRGDERILKWTICLKKHSIIAETIPFVDRQVAGTTWKVALRPKESSTDWLSANDYDTYESDILKIANRFIEIFQCPVKKISVDMGETHDFKKLFIDSTTLLSADCIQVAHNAFTEAEMDHMLDNFVTEKLLFEGTAGSRYKYQKPLRFPIVKLKFAPWIGNEELLNMAQNQKQLELKETAVTNEGLNQLIINWLTGQNGTLEYVEVSKRTDERADTHVFDIPAIREGIVFTPGAQKREELAKHFLSTGHDFQNGVDIRREDGKLATILINLTGYADLFVFAVWSDPNPNKPIEDERME